MQKIINNFISSLIILFTVCVDANKDVNFNELNNNYSFLIENSSDYDIRIANDKGTKITIKARTSYDKPISISNQNLTIALLLKDGRIFYRDLAENKIYNSYPNHIYVFYNGDIKLNGELIFDSKEIESDKKRASGDKTSQKKSFLSGEFMKFISFPLPFPYFFVYKGLQL